MTRALATPPKLGDAGGTMMGVVGSATRRGVVELRELELAAAVGCLHHDDLDADVFDVVDAVYPGAGDRCAAFDRHAERGEEGDCGVEVFDDDADVVEAVEYGGGYGWGKLPASSALYAFKKRS